MTPILEFDPDKLKFIRYDAQNHRLPVLNFAQSSGDDPLGVQDYYLHISAGKFLKNKLIYVLRYEKEWIGFFSIGLTNIRRKSDPNVLGIAEIESNKFTNGLLIDKIGIDQKYRCFGIGRYILHYCIGLAKSIEGDDQIRIIIFETTNSLAEKIYHPKYRFNYVKKEDKLVWAYKPIC
jgi:hypothetical protein